MNNIILSPVSGRFSINESWSIHLPGLFNRRLENATLVLAASDLTLSIDTYWHEAGSLEERMSLALRELPEGVRERNQGTGLEFFSLTCRRAREGSPDVQVTHLAVGEIGYVRIIASSDTPFGALLAQSVWLSLREDLDQTGVYEFDQSAPSSRSSSL